MAGALEGDEVGKIEWLVVMGRDGTETSKKSKVPQDGQRCQSYDRGVREVRGTTEGLERSGVHERG